MKWVAFLEAQVLVGIRKEGDLALVAKERENRSSRRKRAPTVLEQLITGCEAERVAVHFVDGRLLEGALLFNPIKRSGKLINVELEFSVDFEPLEVKEIRILEARLRSTQAMDRVEIRSAPIAPSVIDDGEDEDE
jgi:hypothetical protein